MKKHLFYFWLLPMLWGMFSIVSFFHSGDEHGCFVYGTIAGVWIGFLYQFGTLATALFPILITGIIILCLMGLILDWLRVQKKIWLTFFVLAAIILFFSSVSQFESIQDIRGKHRSVLAIVFMVLNGGIYASIILSILTILPKRLWQLIKRATIKQKSPKSLEKSI